VKYREKLKLALAEYEKNETTANLIRIAKVHSQHVHTPLRVPISGFKTLLSETKGKEIHAFHIVLMSKFNASFGSNRKFITLIEKMMLNYYGGIVQYLTNWNQPAPRI
jgi:hypothetical protein